MAFSFDGTLTVAGNIAHSVGVASFNDLEAKTLRGLLTTPDQPNILGVGTLSKLDVCGNLVQSVGSTTLQSLVVEGNVTVDTSTFRVDSLTNRVGIGTATPSRTLDVNGSLGVTGGVTFLGLSSSAQANTNILHVDTETGSISYAPPPGPVGVLTSLSVTGDLTVDTLTLRVDASNNRVGVVTSAPQYPLDVVGDIHTTGAYQIAGTPVLTANALGTSVTSSNLTTVGTLTALNVAGNVTINGAQWASSVVYGTTTPFVYLGPGTSYTNPVPFYDPIQANGTSFVTPSGPNNNLFTFGLGGTYMLQAEIDVGYPWMMDGTVRTFYLVNHSGGNPAPRYGKETHAPEDFSCTRPYLLTVQANDHVQFIIDSSSGDEYEVGLNAVRLSILKLA